VTFFDRDDWARWRTEERTSLRADLGAALLRYADGPAQHALLARGLTAFDARTMRSTPIAIAHHLPCLIAHAVRGSDPRTYDRSATLPVSRVTALLEIGIDLHDHLADDEVDGELAALPSGATLLIATAYLSCLAPLAIAELPVSAALRSALSAEVATGLLRAAAGQQADHGARTPDETLVALAKTGGRYALYARLAAACALGELDERELDAWGSFAFALGAARQLASDVTDLVSESSRDIASGVITFPLAWGRAEVERRRGAIEAARLDDARRAARAGDRDAHDRVRRALIEVGAIERTVFEIELYCERASGALADTRAHGPAAAALHALIACSAGRVVEHASSEAAHA
jgi:hypothetical protein